MKLYAATFGDGDIYLSTVRKTEKEAWDALISQETWSNCFDMRFSPTKKELKKDGFKIVECVLLRKEDVKT